MATEAAAVWEERSDVSSDEEGETMQVEKSLKGKKRKADAPAKNKRVSKTSKPEEDEEGEEVKKATRPKSNKKKPRKNQTEQRSGLHNLIQKVCGRGVRYAKDEVLNQLNDMVDQILEDLIMLANTYKVNNNDVTFTSKHVDSAIRSSRFPLGMKPVMLAAAGDAIARYKARDTSDDEWKGKSTEARAGLCLYVSRVGKKLRVLAQRGKAKDKATGKAISGSRVSIGSAIALVAAAEVVLTRVICLANNCATGSYKRDSLREEIKPKVRGLNTKITKEDIFQGVALDVSVREDSYGTHPGHKQEEDGLALYFKWTVFTNCGTTKAIPRKLRGVSSAS
jgi:hypothetical protein